MDKVYEDYAEFAKEKRNQYRLPSGPWIVTAARFGHDEVEVHILTNWGKMWLHWGLFYQGEAIWQQPLEPYPVNSHIGNGFLESEFIEDTMLFDSGVYSVHIRIFNLGSIKPKIGGIAFVPHQGDKWYNKDGGDFRINFS